MANFQGQGQKKNKISPKVRDRMFWSKVDIKEVDECWNYKKNRKSLSRYGTFVTENGKIGAHRFAYESATGKIIPKGLYVLHTCDNPLCCNPKHLYCGTQEDNGRDMQLRNRAVGNNAKLYAGEIWLIRRLKRIKVRNLGRYTSRQDFVATMFKVSQAMISGVWNSNKFTCKEGYYI